MLCRAAGPERGGHAVPIRLDPFAILINVDHGAAGPAQVVIRNGFRRAPGDMNCGFCIPGQSQTVSFPIPPIEIFTDCPDPVSNRDKHGHENGQGN